MNLTWFWLALFFALWTSILISAVKKLTEKIDPIFIFLMEGIIILPFMFIIILNQGIPNVTPKFFLFLFGAGIIDVIAGIISYTAIKIAPISLITPISSFNPVFTTIIAAITLKEILSPIKLLGILIIVFGSYILNVSDVKGGILLPFKKLISNRGVQLYFLANFLWAVTPIFQKQAIFQTHPEIPLYSAFIENIMVVPMITLIVIFEVKNKREQLSKSINNWKLFLFLGLGGAVAGWAAFTSFSLAPLGLVTSAFKFSILFTILWGFAFFKEERIWERLLGASVMIAGTILLLR